MKLEEREKVEWTNTWISDANTHNRRGLLIGDSTTRQIRKSMENMLMGGYSVDLFASSFSVNDERLLYNINAFFYKNEYEYDFIILHYGGQHNFSKPCCERCENYNEYYTNYEKLVEYLQTKCDNIVIMTTTSRVLEDNLSVIDEKIENEILARNAIVKDVGNRRMCKIFDLNGLMKTKKYSYTDSIHFSRDADGFMCYEIVCFLIREDVIHKKLMEAQIVKNKKKLLDMFADKTELMIYGIGNIGMQIYWLLKLNGIEQCIKCFVVTNKDVTENYDGKPIIGIYDVDSELRLKGVLITASSNYENALYENGINNGFKNIVSYKDIMKMLSFENIG
jgi:hypothetical protein